MKRVFAIVFISIVTVYGAQAQTAKELLGKWKLVKWTNRGKEKSFPDSTYQVFKDGNEFISISEGKEHKGKWKLSKDNNMLTIRSGLIIVVDFKFDYFDSKKRIITADQVGTLEYEKVD